MIGSRTRPDRDRGAGNERFDARRRPRSSATQHKTRAWRNSCRPPRTSQIPVSGRCQWSQTQCNSRVRFIHKSWEIGAPYLFEVISIYASLASSALGHRGLQHFHRNTGFARFCGYFQINRDNLKYFLHDVRVTQVQLDELSALLSAVKDGEVSEAEAIKRLSRSPHWVWVAIDPVSKLLLTIDVGARTL